MTVVLKAWLFPSLTPQFIKRRLFLAYIPVRCCDPPDVGYLRTLGGNEVPELAGRKADLGLLLVEGVEVAVQCVAQSEDIALWMQHFPRLMALLCFARFENHEECVEPVGDMLKRPAPNVVTRHERGCVVAVVIVDLIRVALLGFGELVNRIPVPGPGSFTYREVVVFLVTRAPD